MSRLRSGQFINAPIASSMMSSCIECSRNKSSGKDVVWPQLEALLAFDRDGDTVAVHSMDRLARNLDDLRRLVRALTGKGVRVQFVTENLTFTGENTAMAKLLLSVMGAFAEFERALIRLPRRNGRRPCEGAAQGPATEAVDQAADRVAPHARHRRLHHH